MKNQRHYPLIVRNGTTKYRRPPNPRPVTIARGGASFARYLRKGAGVVS